MRKRKKRSKVAEFKITFNLALPNKARLWVNGAEENMENEWKLFRKPRGNMLHFL